ncbi:hypothetical protein L596_016788 [Steinernema carpocapsae]|uniref:SF4 helicase domain-containing protein n=1 Tax=Steinernema carpocapsae TaxID=34508 RepID=A0A4U5NKF0_STECR|nr:hypothetical protein L596_016788 [Steinernema carpocapsae]
MLTRGSRFLRLLCHELPSCSTRRALCDAVPPSDSSVSSSLHRQNGYLKKRQNEESTFDALLETITKSSDNHSELYSKAEIVKENSAAEVEVISYVCKFLHANELDFEISKYTKNVRTVCPHCSTLNPNPLKTAVVSRLDGSVACVVCDYDASFMDYKNEIYVRQQRGTLLRPKRSVGFIEPDDSSYQFSLPTGNTVFIPSTERSSQQGQGTSKAQDTAMSNFGDLDTDLYDRVSYLNLINQHDERERQRKADQFESMRRLREEADKLSARGQGAADLSDSSPPNVGPQSSSSFGATTANQVDPMIRSLWNEAIDLSDLRDAEDQTTFLSLRMLLGVDRISPETLARFHIKGHLDSYDNAALCYPRYKGPSGRTRPPSGLKIIRKVGEQMEKENYPEPDEFGQSKFSGIFGYHMVTPSDRTIILTTNERDALAVYDASGGMLTVALPKAERVDYSVIPYLEDFDKIFLWFPSHHEKFAQDYASYLNGARCFLITKRERPIELVRDGRAKEINRAIRDEAVRIRNRGFRSMIDVRNELRDEILNANSKMIGLATFKRFDVLNKYLQGFRPGELTVLTGATGIGKTTFLCEYSLDLFMQGVRTLFCSFEMQEEKILRWMLVQYAGVPLHRVEHHASVEQWLDRFERTKGALIIMKVDEFRNRSINQIANAIKDQVVSAGIQHVVIDNLQFLIGLANLNDEKASALERFNQQDRFVGLMRKMATDYGVHVTLVVHPRKTDSDTDLDIHHLGGSARVTQEADNVLVMQRRKSDENGKSRKFLHILKNRHGGPASTTTRSRCSSRSPPTPTSSKSGSEAWKLGSDPSFTFFALCNPLLLLCHLSVH